MGSKIKSGNVSFDLKRFAGIKRDYSKEEVEKLSVEQIDSLKTGKISKDILNSQTKTK